MDRIGFFVMLTFSSVLASTDGGLSDHVYRKIDVVEGNACYRLFNGTHQFGCHGDDENTNGVVIVMLKESDLTDIENCWRKRFANYHGKFWIVTRLSLLTREVMYKLHSSDCISGIAIYDHKEDLDPTNTEAFSDDDSCPNREFDYYQQTEGTCGVKINRDGAQFEEGGRNIHWKLQIAYIRNPEDVDAVKKCYELFNDPAAEKKETYPLCGMSFKLFNTGAGSTDICFRRGQPSAKMIDVNIESSFGQTFCSPLSGHNLFAWPTPVSNLDKLKKHPKYMMIATRMDSFGLIPEMSPGEVTVLTSLITILAVAKAINQSIDKFEEASNRTHKNVMFALFNGEAYDYIGSGATAYRMITHEFPLPPLNFTHLGHIDVTDLEVIVEPQLIGASGHQLFTHVDGHRYSAEQKQIDALVTAMSTGASKFGGNVGKPKANGKVPSSSWHTFAKHDAKVQAIVLGPFDEVYRYLRFNSMQDENVWSEEHRTQTIDGISAAANAIFYSAAEYTGAVVKNETVDRDFISILFDCFINSTDWYSCDFFEKINGGRINKTFTSYTHYGKSTYVSVSNGNPLRFFLHWLMMFAIGSETHASNVRDMNSCTHLSEGQAVYTYVWQPNPYTGVYSCLRSSVQFTQLHSPAFDIPGYDMKNKTFSTWTESVYTIDELRLFLIQDTSIDTYMLVIGAVVALLSFYFVGRCSESTFIIDENDARAEEGEPL